LSGASLNTLANGLGLAGAFLTTVGVLITLLGTRRFRTWLAARRSGPVHAAGGSVAGVGVLAGKARGRSGPPAEGLTLEWVYETHQQQIDALGAEIDTHRHPGIDRDIARVAKTAEDVRADALRRIEDLDTAAAKAEKWNIWGLVVVGAGAALQVSAFVVAL